MNLVGVGDASVMRRLTTVSHVDGFKNMMKIWILLILIGMTLDSFEKVA